MRLILNDVSRVWRVAVHADYLTAQEEDQWAAKFASSSGATHTILSLPSLPARKTVEIEVQGRVHGSSVEIIPAQALRSEVIPVVSLQDRGLVWLVTRVHLWPTWRKIFAGIGVGLLPLLGLIGTGLRKQYDAAIRAQLLRDVLPEHARHYARRLVADGLTESATSLLIGAVQNDGATKQDILNDPNLHQLWELDDEFRRFFS